MAETTKFTYVSLNNLNQYTTLSKKYFEGKISEADARSLKTVAIEGHTLKFYKVVEPVGDTAPAYTIELPETDLSDFMHLIKNATAGDVVIANANGSVADGGVKLADLAKSADVTKEIGDAKTELNKKVEANTTAIAKLNGAEDAEGSVAKAVQDSLDKADSALQEADVATLRADVAANKASLAEGGATANAIKANKEAAAKAQGDVNALATRVETLESVKCVEATEAEIKAMFPTA